MSEEKLIENYEKGKCPFPSCEGKIIPVTDISKPKHEYHLQCNKCDAFFKFSGYLDEN